MGVYYHFYALDAAGHRSAYDAEGTMKDEVLLDKPFGHIHEWVWGLKRPEWADLRLAILGPPGEEEGGEEVYLVPEQVTRAAAAIQRVSRAEVEQIVRSGTDDEESIHIVLADFEALQRFYAKAAASGNAVFAVVG